MKKRMDETVRGEMALFVRGYARKAQRGIEPNDRSYDRKMEKLMKSLPPEDLSKFLNDDDPEVDQFLVMHHGEGTIHTLVITRFEREAKGGAK